MRHSLFTIAMLLFCAVAHAQFEARHVHPIALTPDGAHLLAVNSPDAALSVYLAWFAARLVWVSYATHDISPGADVTPLWIPQLSMALGCAGLAVGFLHGLVARWRGQEFIAPAQSGHTE